jgi:hypothetical protein
MNLFVLFVDGAITRNKNEETLHHASLFSGYIHHQKKMNSFFNRIIVAVSANLCNNALELYQDLDDKNGVH